MKMYKLNMSIDSKMQEVLKEYLLDIKELSSNDKEHT